MNKKLCNFLRRHRRWFSASARRRSKAAKLGWAKRRLHHGIVKIKADLAEPKKDKWGLTSDQAIVLYAQGKYPPKDPPTP